MPSLSSSNALQVDSALETIPRAERPIVLALVHCPPEQLQLGFPYHAVPASDWGFAFCDALGLSDAIPEAAAPAATDAAAPGANRLATDPRRWVAVGYGRLDRPTPAEARVEFEAEFVKVGGEEGRGAVLRALLLPPFLHLLPSRLYAQSLRSAVSGIKMDQFTRSAKAIKVR